MLRLDVNKQGSVIISHHFCMPFDGDVLCSNARPVQDLSYTCAMRGNGYTCSRDIHSLSTIGDSERYVARVANQTLFGLADKLHCVSSNTTFRLYTETDLHTSCGIVEQREAALDVFDSYLRPLSLLAHQI